MARRVALKGIVGSMLESTSPNLLKKGKIFIIIFFII
jgi:hypothetical protein